MKEKKTPDNDPVRVLLVDDDEDAYLVIDRLFSQINGDRFNLQWTETYETALRIIEDGRHDVYLIDYFLGKRSGLDLLRKMISIGCKAPIILLTGQGSEVVAVEAMKLGIQDYLMKESLTSKDLNRSISNAIEKVSMRREIEKQQREIQTAHQEMLAQLEQARTTQKTLLPQRMPEIPGVQLTAKYAPVEQIGGDLYDVLKLGQDKLGIFLADITGHGISAALISFMVSGLFKNIAPEAESPQTALHHLNHSLYGKLPEEKYATAFYGVYEGDTHSLTFVSAGFSPGYLLRKSERMVFPLRSTGMLLGVFANSIADYQQEILPLQPGDKVFLYTDGLIESKNAFGEMFGQHRLERFLQQHTHLPIKELLEAVYAHALEYSEYSKFDDDITLIGLELEDDRK